MRSIPHHIAGLTLEGVAYGWKNTAVLQAYSAILPQKDQELLLRAALLDDQQALDQWTATADLQALDPATLRLLPLLHPKLNHYGVPETLKAKVEEAYSQTRMQNRILFQDLLRAVDAFDQAAIPTLLLKGSALILQYYGRRRSSTDGRSGYCRSNGAGGFEQWTC